MNERKIEKNEEMIARILSQKEAGVGTVDKSKQ